MTSPLRLYFCSTVRIAVASRLGQAPSVRPTLLLFFFDARFAFTCPPPTQNLEALSLAPNSLW